MGLRWETSNPWNRAWICPILDQGILKEPLLYLSLYFKTHRQRYYELLNEVRLKGNWEAWLEFFARAVIFTANQAVETAQQLLSLVEDDRNRIKAVGRSSLSVLEVHRALEKRPITSSGWLVETTGITPATVNKALSRLIDMGVVKELTARKRGRLYSYAAYIELLSRGTELP